VVARRNACGADSQPQETCTDRYAEQLKEDVEWRKEVAENAGLGFKLHCRKFNWATWATKAAKIAVAESRLTD
jgi:hypothetical protein